jgi:hypothetical protein
MQNLIPFLAGGLVLLPFVGVIALIVGIAVWSHKKEKQRTDHLRAVAADLGLPFFEDGDPALVAQLGGFQLFSLGRGRRAFNMLHGDTDDVDVAIFDYQYTTGSGKNRHTRRQTVICIDSTQLNLPAFALRPENFADRIGQWFGFRDLDFETHPKFSSLFLLRGEDEAGIRELFGPGVLEFFENTPPLCAEAAGTRLICYRSGQRVEPAAMRAWLDEGFRVYVQFREAGKTA